MSTPADRERWRRAQAARRARQKSALVADACCICGAPVTAASAVLVLGETYCRPHGYAELGHRRQAAARVIRLPMTNARPSMTNADPRTNAAPTVILEQDNQAIGVKSVENNGPSLPPPIVPLPSLPAQRWSPPELEDRARRVAVWFGRRSGQSVPRRDAVAVAALTMPLPALLTALERAYRQAVANGLRPRTLRLFWTDLKEAEAQHHKAGAPKKRPGGVRSIAELMAERRDG